MKQKTKKRRHKWNWKNGTSAICKVCGAIQKYKWVPSERGIDGKTLVIEYEYRGEKHIIKKMPECTGEE